MTPYPLKIPGRLPPINLTRKTPDHWKNLPRRKCDNCGKSYKPSQPFKKGQKFGFCQRKCKDQFHLNKGAYTHVRAAIPKEITKQLRLHDRCPTCRIRRNKSACPDCHGTGEVFTPLGLHLREFVVTLIEEQANPKGETNVHRASIGR